MGRAAAPRGDRKERVVACDVSGQADRRSYSSWLELFQAVLVKGKKEGGKLRNAHLGEFPIVDFSRLNVMV